MAPRKRKVADAVPVANAMPAALVQNGLADVFGMGGFPQNQSSPFTEQVSNATTIFKNLRWWLVSNLRQMLSEAYVELGLVQAICDIPVDDALKGGVEFTSDQLDESQLGELKTTMDRDDDLMNAGQAMKWCRLFGGAGILILTDQDPSEELDIDSITEDSDLEFRAVDMWELFWDKQNTQGYDPTIQSEDFTYYSYYGEKVHKSRVMRLKGLTAPSFIRPRLWGWGFSVVEVLVRSINQYLKATDLGFEVLDEFKLDIYKIKNLVNTLLSPNGQQKIQERIRLANYTKNYQNSVVMDAEDDYIQKQLSFSGLAEAMQGIRMQVASDMRMPMIKLFGTPATGLNANDESSIEVYNSMVEGQVRNKLKYHILRIAELRCQKLFGFVPDDLSLKFAPLRELNAVDEETVKTQKYQRLIQAKQAGEITTKEFRDACNRDALLSIHLETDDATIDDIMDEAIEKSQAAMGDTEDPGTDRADTDKPKAGEKGGAGKDPVKKKPDKPEQKAKANALILPKPFTEKEHSKRLKNSPAFDKASYEADGGNDWIDPRRKELFDRDKAKNKVLWDSAERQAEAAGGDWRMVVWLYKKLGGAF